MKLLKMQVLKDPFGTAQYPTGFLGIPCLEHLYYDDLSTGICWLLVAMQDEDFKRITDLKNVFEITVDEIDKISAMYDPPKEVITDEVKMRRIELKTRAGIALTDDEIKALDPNDATLGIGFQKRFVDNVKTRLGL